MKNSRRWIRQLSLTVAGLLIGLPEVLAAPGGGAAVGAAGAASTGGGHSASTTSTGVAHSAGPSSGGRSSVGSTSGFRTSSVGNLGATGYRVSGFTTGGNRTVAGAGFSGNAFGQRTGTAQAASYGNYSSIARVNNAWSDPVNPRAGTAGVNTRYGGYTNSYRNDPVYSTRPGNHLYVGAYGDGSNRFSDGRSRSGQNGGNGYRDRHRYYYNNFPYGVYYPYLYSSYGYGGYGNYGYGGGVADYSGVGTDSSVTDLGAPDFSNNPNNYYSYVVPEQNAPDTNQSAPASSQPLPDAPAVGPQIPALPDKSAGAVPGPDSLVEAVQNELSHRGYFDGRPDSMYSPATKEAIRRFQTDQGLPATGRINEATLHALRLD